MLEAPDEMKFVVVDQLHFLVVGFLVVYLFALVNSSRSGKCNVEFLAAFEQLRFKLIDGSRQCSRLNIVDKQCFVEVLNKRLLD
jgi:hypothetical protein